MRIKSSAIDTSPSLGATLVSVTPLAERLQAAVKTAGLAGESKLALSKRFGLSPSHVGQIMNGHKTGIDAGTARRIAAVLGVSWLWLQTGEEGDPEGAARWRDHEAWDVVLDECRRIDPNAPWDAVGAMTIPPGCTPTVRAALALATGVAEAMRAGNSTPLPGSTVRTKRGA